MGRGKEMKGYVLHLCDDINPLRLPITPLQSLHCRRSGSTLHSELEREAKVPFLLSMEEQLFAPIQFFFFFFFDRPTFSSVPQ